MTLDKTDLTVKDENGYLQGRCKHETIPLPVYTSRRVDLMGHCHTNWTDTKN